MICYYANMRECLWSYYLICVTLICSEILWITSFNTDGSLAREKSSPVVMDGNCQSSAHFTVHCMSHCTLGLQYYIILHYTTTLYYIKHTVNVLLCVDRRRELLVLMTFRGMWRCCRMLSKVSSHFHTLLTVALMHRYFCVLTPVYKYMKPIVWG